MRATKRITAGAIALVSVVWLATDARAETTGSQRLDRAKDYIADELWPRAIGELKAAAADPAETNKDEALFWLAHSYNQAGDQAAAVETVQRLERDFVRSRWVKPARSLRIEIAQRLGRNDVLWWMARPVTAPMPPTPPTPPPVRGPRAKIAATPPAPPRPPILWVPEGFTPDMDLRIQALGGLVLTEDAPQAIHMLRDIALQAPPGQARRALYALTQSKRPEARLSVVEVANTAPEPVQVAAVRELARIPGPEISVELLKVYSKAGEPVKYQVVTSFGQRAEAMSLLRIVESEHNASLRDTAIITLARAPTGRDHVRLLYNRVALESKRSVIVALFNARDEDGLIQIAERERVLTLKREALEKLRLLGTPKAKQYLERVKQK